MLRRTRVFVILLFLVSVPMWKGYDVYTSITADNSQPVISLESDSITISVRDGDEAIMQGVSAEDARDGDLTDKVFIENRKRFVEKGKFTVTYAVADSDDHFARATREVIYSDYVSPQFELSEPLEFQASNGSQDDVNIAAHLSAHDVLDGNISNKIRISGEYKMSSTQTGDYPMEFIVMNSMGDTVTLPVTVRIYELGSENYRPVLKLKHCLINTPVGTSVNLDDMIESISYHGTTYYPGNEGGFYSGEYDKDGEPIMIPASYVSRTGEVDFSDPGVYEITYTYNDVEGEITSDTRLIVVVYD